MSELFKNPNPGSEPKFIQTAIPCEKSNLTFEQKILLDIQNNSKNGLKLGKPRSQHKTNQTGLFAPPAPRGLFD